MMFSLNYIRLRANAIWTIDINTEGADWKLPIKFKFEAIIVNKKLSNSSKKNFKALRQQLKKYANYFTLCLIFDYLKIFFFF